MDVEGPEWGDGSDDDAEPLSTEEVELIEEEGHAAADELEAFKLPRPGADDDETR